MWKMHAKTANVKTASDTDAVFRQPLIQSFKYNKKVHYLERAFCMSYWTINIVLLGCFSYVSLEESMSLDNFKSKKKYFDYIWIETILLLKYKFE